MLKFFCHLVITEVYVFAADVGQDCQSGIKFNCRECEYTML